MGGCGCGGAPRRQCCAAPKVQSTLRRSTQVPASRAADNVSLLLHTDMGPFRRGYGILAGALAAVNRGGFGEFSEAWPTATMGTPTQPTAVEVALVSGGEIAVSWRPPVWDGGFPLHHYALALRRWDAPQQRWEGVQLEGRPAEIEVPATPTTATAGIAATGADADDDDTASGGGGGGGGSSAGLQVYRLGTLAPAEYRAELRAVNTQGDAGARALSARVRVPGGWCGWEAAEGEGGAAS